ncbi:flotillin domain-containing protein [Metarhizium guizhouense ARSEF 977]|uniref:Flotillin domain-containing protein n=1 Tax=Metarhizium guizhouense (strain ARSEF 977) TaxID=1276136 RepID=A0A0B4H693_METGA|nr:flotillin domain-containing protein [Metarhizium guizhouense ARSEF 977]
MLRYKVSGPDEYLAITGWRVRTVKITKSSLVWPFQRYTRFSVQPHDYAMDLQAMTKEKLQFSLPVVFTVGPDVNARGANSSSEAESANEGTAGREGAAGREDNGDALMKYAMLLAGSDDKKTDARAHVASIVKGIIEGETRVLVSSMTMEEIFTEREMFKKRIFRNIQGELDQFGLKIYNSKQELKDAPGSVYFASLSRKAHEGATNQARIDVAEAQLRGNVGEAKRKGEQEREIAKIQADTAVQKTERDIERAAAEARLMTQQTHLTRDVDVTRVEAQRALESKDEDLKKQVEIKRAAAEMERLRAKDVVQATIARESKQQAADAAAYEVTANARANQEANQRLADADAYKTRVGAEAENYAAQQSADASAFRQLKEAEGISAMADAYAKLAGAFGGPAGLLQYMMIEKGTYVELAKANAEAIRGLQPKISVWNTGASGAGEASSSDPTAAMRNVYQMLPPLMTTINEQTGITLPEWQFGKLNAGVQAMNQSNVNGHKAAN